MSGWLPNQPAFMWQDYQVNVSNDGDHTFQLNKTGGKTTARSNMVTFEIYQGTKTGPSDIKTVTYTQTTYFITPGQPYNGVTTGSGSAGATVTIEAGRHGSTTNAATFDTDTGGNMLPTDTNADSRPSKLNFGTCGTITFTLVSGKTINEDVCIAQGHVEQPAAYIQVGESGNNWWIGGPTWTNRGCLDNQDVTIQISSPGGTESTTRNDTFLVMNSGNPGLAPNAKDDGLKTPIC